MVGSRAAAPFGEERICKVSVRLTSEGSLRFCPESFLHECDLSGFSISIRQAGEILISRVAPLPVLRAVHVINVRREMSIDCIVETESKLQGIL